MTRRKKLAASIIVLGGFGGGILSSAAFAERPNFLTVSWWGKVSHDSVKSYVARKYEGDWSPYVKKWERQLSRMTKIRDRGKTALIKSRKLRLSGDSLSIDVEQIRSASPSLAALPKTPPRPRPSRPFRATGVPELGPSAAGISAAYGLSLRGNGSFRTPASGRLRLRRYARRLSALDPGQRLRGV